MAICREEYNKLYYSVFKHKYQERYAENREQILEKNRTKKSEKAEYDKARYKRTWKSKSEYNREYYRRKKCESLSQ